MPEDTTIFTVGHSALAYESFLLLLKGAGVTAVVDVRSSPYSRYNRQYNREILRNELRLDGVDYRFFGKQLGGRPSEAELFTDGIADYEKMANIPQFEEGLQLVISGARKHNVALMCSEHDPLDCHRCLLVGRALAARGVAVKHIKSDGSIADHREIEERLLELERQDNDDLFLSHNERLADAYRRRARRVAYAEQRPVSSSGHAAAE